ncbi:hypothetical protein QBC42DRAFT_303609 [Cladorrhinum samala]|uniref:Uncharacterized protein n=1 Tax=Cladorrhinum samala TaxID=585594 RepID=A0AAV9HVU5_9PEZI|nr:hypothetical protein QBC42DRAFT_303609 [Cladorrhinum samala]
MLKIEPASVRPLKGSKKKILYFSYCFGTRFAGVNIFESFLYSFNQSETKMRTDTMMLRMSGLLSRIALPASFTSTSSSTTFNSTIASWLMNPEFRLLPNGSIVGLCCSNLLALQFQEENNSDLEQLTADFQRFLLAASFSHTPSRNHGTGKVCTAGHMSGSRFLLRLDRILTPQYLSRLSRSSCQVLFLLVLGAVLGTGYSQSPDLRNERSPAFPSEMLAMNPDLQQNPTLGVAMREHLCQMLAHHLIFLGGLLGIKLDAGLDKKIIESAGRGWGKTLTTGMGPNMETGGYVWGDEITQRDAAGVESCRPSPRSVVERRKGKTTSPIIAEQPPPPPPPPSTNPYWSSPKHEIVYTPPSSPLEPSRSPLVPIACGPELAHFHQFQNQNAAQDWDQNPASYLDMEYDEPENYYNPAPQNPAEEREKEMESKMMLPFPRSNTEPCYNYAHEQTRQEYAIPREVKRRTMWIVRTVDAGEPYGQINMHARLRGGRDLEGLRSFV